MQNMEVISLNKFISEDTNKHFKADQHADILTDLYTLFEEKKFCDITLFFGEDREGISTHQVILSASSTYFKEKLQSKVSEKIPVIKLPEFNFTTAKSVLNFMYTGKIDIKSSTVENILNVAETWQLKALKDLCLQFLSDDLNANNCLGTKFFAEDHGYTDLANKSNEYVLRFFENVREMKEFLLLDENQLQELLSCPDVIVVSEESIFHALITWIRYDLRNREHFLSKLLYVIRFHDLTPEFISQNRDSVCRRISFWLDWHLKDEIPSKNPQQSRHCFTRIALITWTKACDLEIKIFNHFQNTWNPISISDLQSNIENFSIIYTTKRSVIIAGGQVDNIVINDVKCFNFKYKKWFILPKMKTPRKDFELIEFNNEIYAFGGYDQQGNHIRSAEKYNFETRQWNSVRCPDDEDFEVVATKDCIKAIMISPNKCTIYKYNSLENNWNLFGNLFLEKPCTGIQIVAADNLGLYLQTDVFRYLNMFTQKFVYLESHDINDLICLGVTSIHQLIAVGKSGTVKRLQGSRWKTLPSVKPLNERKVKLFIS